MIKLASIYICDLIKYLNLLPTEHIHSIRQYIFRRVLKYNKKNIDKNMSGM
jgi:hypothetical protein